jgi:predicted permease
MSVRALLSRLRALGRRRIIDSELAEEIAEHLQLATEEKQAAGLSSRDARDAARREFGNPTLVRESSADAWGWPALDALAADLRFGLRVMRKHWISTTVAIAALGVAIGVTSGVLSLLGDVLNHRYPYADQDRLALVWARRVTPPRYDELQVSLPELRLWQRTARQTAIAGFSWTQSANVLTGTEPVRTPASIVTSNLLSVLGVSPTLGRDFTAADEREDAPNAAIVTYDFWKNELGGSGAALTVPLIIDRQRYAIVGVAPKNFRLPLLLKVKILLPARGTRWASDRTARAMVAMGRLAPAATLASVMAELDPISAQFNDADPRDRGVWAVNAENFSRSVRRHVKSMLDALFATSMLVLIIACANVAILLLARIPGRRQELTVRLALGAEPRRIVWQLLAESMLLALAAAAIGIALARPTMALMFRLFDGSMPFEWQPTIDVRVALIAIGIAGATCLAFGMAPALSVVRSLRANGALSATRTSGAAEQEWLRSALMTLEVALSLLLVVGGGLMIESMVALDRRPLGFESSNLVTARILLDTTRYRTGAAQQAFFETLASRLAGHAELRDATIASSVPLGNTGEFSNYVTREPAGVGDRPDTLTATATVVMPNYLDAMHVPLVSGRMVGERETEPVVVVNERMAKQLWPGENPIGKRLRVLAPMYADGESVAAGERTVVGVSRNVRPSPLMVQDSWPAFFLPFSQQPVRNMTIVVRAATPAIAASAMRAEVHAIDPALPVFAIKSVAELMDYWVSYTRINTLILDMLAGIGAVLTLIGIYSIVAVFVSQRTREIGIRIAIGAQRTAVVWMVVKRTLRPALIGLIVGTALALFGTRLLETMLVGVSPLEPRAYIGAAVLVIAVVASAAWLPARRAARLDPIRALRVD